MEALSTVEEACGELGETLKDTHQRRHELLRATETLERLVTQLNTAVNNRQQNEAGSREVLLARIAARSTKDDLEWIRVYGEHATEAQLREKLSHALSNGIDAVNYLSQINSSHK